MFYVYEWFIVATGEVIYIGKGTKNRYKAKKKNKFLNRLLEDNECDVRIVAYYETEEEAFEAERQRIVSYKSIGQAVCNKISYSTGGVNKIWTTEKRDFMSVNNPMKDQAQRDRMSKNNPMHNPEIAKSVGEKKRIKVKIDGVIYDSVTIAAAHFGVSQATIKNWSRAGKCEYIRPLEESKSYTQKIENTHSVLYNGKEYQYISSLAKELGKHETTIMQWVKNGFDSQGNPCRYKDDTTDHIFKPQNRKGRSRPVIVNGVHYSSIVDASQATGISKDRLWSYLKGYVKNPPVQCKYDNQQPIRGKSDNSTTEGSTTNE